MNNISLLKDVANYVEDRILSSALNVESYISTENLLPNKAGVKSALSLPPTGSKSPAYRGGDILISNIRPYLKKIWFSNKDGGCSADVLVLRAKDGVDPKFLYYALLRDDFFEHAMRGAKGTKMPRGDKSQILEFSIPKFSLEKQSSIASVLSVIDAKIDCNNRINAELESIANMLYDYWFVQFNFPDQSGRPYKLSGGVMVYDEIFKREIPVGWCNAVIDEILDKPPSSAKVPNQDILVAGNIPVLDQGQNYIAGFTNEVSALIKPMQPHVVFGDHTRAVKLVNFNYARGADGTQILISKDSRLPGYLMYQTVARIDLSNYGYARHFKFLKETKIILPAESISSKYQAIVSPMYEEIKKLIFENLELAKLRDWLLPMLMNRQITLS